MEKRTLNRIIVGWILLLIIVALFGKVTVAAPTAGETSADFLNIGLGARSAGMGGAFTAVSEGAPAAYWNPAGLGTVEHGEVTLSHFSWFQDITMEQGVFAYRLGDKSSLAASISFMNYGTIDGRDDMGLATGDISVYDWFGAVSYAYAVSPKLSLGVTGKFINQKLDEVSGSGLAADFGVKYQMEWLTLAVVAANMGKAISFDGLNEQLPTSGRVGAAVRFLDDQLLTSVDVEKRLHGDWVLRQGVEYGYRDQYFIRTGYNFYPSQDDRSFGAGPSFGAGVRFESLELDYAYTVREGYTSDDLHRFSVAFKFGN